MSGRKGAATSVNCSQYSSTDDDQRPATIRSSSWTLLKPATSSARRRRSRSPNMKRLGASGSGGGGGTGTCFRTMPAEGLQHAEAFAERFGEIGKKHNAEAAGEHIVGFVRKGERLGVGFAEFDVGEASFASEFFSKRHHAGTQVGRGHTAGGGHFPGDGERRIADAAGAIEDAHAGPKTDGLKNFFGRSLR